MILSQMSYLPGFATLSVDMLWADDLDRVIRAHEVGQKDSKSPFVRNELEFARGCLALIRGEAQMARAILEPLAGEVALARRHRILGHAYETLGLLKDAAAEYERALDNPYEKWAVGELKVPAVLVLKQLRLAGIYERLGDTDRARHWYERFLTDWKDADPDIPELIEAKKRMAALGEVEKLVVQ